MREEIELALRDTNASLTMIGTASPTAPCSAPMHDSPPRATFSAIFWIAETHLFELTREELCEDLNSHFVVAGQAWARLSRECASLPSTGLISGARIVSELYLSYI